MSDAPAPIEHRGGYYHMQNGVYSQQGELQPTYGAHNPAPPLPEEQAEKYHDSTPDYGVAAIPGSVQSEELPAPTALPASPQPATVDTASTATMDAANTTSIAKQVPEKAEVTTPSIDLPPLQADEQIAGTNITQPTSGEDLEAQAQDLTDAKINQTIKQEAPTDQKPATEKQPVAAEPAPTDSITFLTPVRGDIFSQYGEMYNGRKNEGLRIRARSGEPIRASESGKVIYVGDSLASYGKTVVISHTDNWITAYGHLADYLVAKGDVIVRGQLLGFVGKTGSAKEPHLLFMVRKDKKPTDPKPLLK